MKMKDTCGLFFFDYSEMDYQYGKQALEAIYSALRSSKGVCAFNDGDLFNSDTAREIAQQGSRVEPAEVFGQPLSPFVDLSKPFSFGCYVVAMWTDSYENFDILHNSFETNTTPGYRGFVALEGASDRHAFQGLMERRLFLPKSIMLVNGKIKPETSKYGIGHALSKEDLDLLNAAYKGDADAAAAAISCGANINCERPNEPGATPLMAAVMGNQVEVARFLIQAGADSNISNGSNTVLMLAAKYGQLEMVRILLEGGADVNLQIGGYTALSGVDGEEGVDYERIVALLKAKGGVADRQTERFSAGNSLRPAIESLSKLAGRASELLDAFLQGGDDNDLEQSIAFATKAVQGTEYFAPENVDRRTMLGRALRERYRLRGGLEDLQLAITQFEFAVEKLDSEQHDVAIYANNLAVALLDRYERLEDDPDLRRSVELHRLASTACDPDTSSFALYHNNLSNAMLKLDEVDAENDYSDECIRTASVAVENTPEDSPDLPMFLSTLAAAMEHRFRQFRDPGDCAGAIALYRRAIKLLPERSPSLSHLHGGLGRSLVLRSDETFDPRDFDEGIRNLEISAQLGAEQSLGKGLESARIWMMVCFNADRWTEVERAYTFVEETVSKLVEGQLYRDQIEAWLQDSQGLAAHAAYALAQLDRPAEASCLLERGIARLLNRTLALDNVDLLQLTETGREDLGTAYLGALERLRQLDKQAPHTVLDPTMRRQAVQDLESVIYDIRSLSGFEDFLVQPDQAGIAEAARLTTLTYLASTLTGGVAIIIRPGYNDHSVDAETVWLPSLTATATAQAVAGEQVDARRSTGFLNAYFSWRSHRDGDAFNTWKLAIDSTSHWMWDAAIGHIFKRLRVGEALTLIPIGRLGFLPWHAASYEDPSTVSGRRYAADMVPIRYAPSAASLTAAHSVAERNKTRSLIAVQQSHTPGLPPLPYAKFEICAVQSAFRTSKVLREEAATRRAVLAEIARHDVLHFAGHGIADLNVPLESGLFLAKKKCLTLKQLLNVRTKGLRLAVLSACETGVIGSSLPDEVVNLPTGLLLARTAGVIASLWAVTDLSSSLLMARFYNAWQFDGIAVIEALRKAQIWLRDTDNAEKIAYLRRLPMKGECWNATECLVKELSSLAPTATSFSHPYHWAAFVLVGL